jgi:hypothetical protein
MSDYPLVILPNEVEVQAAVNTNTFRVIQVAENPDEMWVNAFVSGAPQNVWVSVLTPENYFPDWTDDDVVNAVAAWAENTYPSSLQR